MDKVLEYIGASEAGRTAEDIKTHFELTDDELSQLMFELKKARAIYGRQVNIEGEQVTFWWPEKKVA